MKNKDIEAELASLLDVRVVQINYIRRQCFSVRAHLWWANYGYHEARILDLEIIPALETLRERWLANWIDWESDELVTFCERLVYASKGFQKYNRQIKDFVAKCKRRKIDLNAMLDKHSFFKPVK